MRARNSLRAGDLIAVAVITAVVFAGIGAMIHNLSGSHYGYDFRGIFSAARSVSDGRNPYVGATRRALLLKNNPYVLPPLIAELCVPLSGLSFSAAVAIFNVICAAALLASLWMLGVRHPGVYLLVAFSLPFIDSLWLGQPDGVFALALTIAWRYRGRWPATAAVAFLVAAKLLLWPLIVWLLLTRRGRSAVEASIASALLLAVSWGAIGFQGVSGYVHRLNLDAQAFAPRSHSVAGAVIRIGSSFTAAEIVGVAVAVGLVAVLLRASRSSDHGKFTAAVMFALFVSPLMWSHYLVIVFVPLVVARRDLAKAYLLSALFYLSPVEPAAHVWQILLVPVVASAMALLAVRARTTPGPEALRPA